MYSKNDIIFYGKFFKNIDYFKIELYFDKFNKN